MSSLFFGAYEGGILSIEICPEENGVIYFAVQIGYYEFKTIAHNSRWQFK